MTICMESHVTLLANVSVMLLHKSAAFETNQCWNIALYNNAAMELHTTNCWILQDGTRHHMVQTTTYADGDGLWYHHSGLVCEQEVTLCEFLIYNLSAFYSLLEDFQHHNLPPEVKYWKPFITRLQIYPYIMTEYQPLDLWFLLFLTSLLAMNKNEDDKHFIFLITKCLFLNFCW